MNAVQSRPEPPTEDQVGRAFRRLADEHIEARHNDSEGMWRRLSLGERRGLALVAEQRRRPAWLLGAAVAACGVALASAFVVVFWRSSNDFDVEGGNRSGAVVATEDTAARITFNEDSTVALSPHTTLRVTTTADAHVVSRLAHGEIDVHVVHQEDTDYRFWAGPYEVLVVGTSFRLTFEPKNERMQLALREGKVRIFDAGRRATDVASGTTVAFEAGRSLSPDVGATPAAEGGATTSSDSSTVAALDDANRAARPEAARGETTSRGAPESSSYAAWAASGRFTAIVEDARRVGVDKVLAEKSAGDLQQLAQAANYTGQPDLAKRTWSSMLRRFPGQPAATNANFFLGRLSEQAGDRGRALGYFNAYLAKAPRGTYAAEALGRKLVLVDRSAAPALAREYLVRFPHGAYAENARRLVASE